MPFGIPLRLVLHRSGELVIPLIVLIVCAFLITATFIIYLGERERQNYDMKVTWGTIFDGGKGKRSRNIGDKNKIGNRILKFQNNLSFNEFNQ